MMKKKFFSAKTALLVSAAAVLLVGSAVGSTRAALTYYSENYGAQISVPSIGVSLVENGTVVSSRDYEGNTWSESEGELLTGLLAEGEKVTLGQDYTEELSVTNSGTIDTFVRVILTKSWQDESGAKDTSLSPELIDLNLLTGNGWVIDESASTRERTVLYYASALASGESTTPLSDTISIDPAVGTKVTRTESTDAEGNTTITMEYAYDGYTFHLDAEVDAVQTHNAEEAIRSAWGVDVVSDGNTISLR